MQTREVYARLTDLPSCLAHEAVRKFLVQEGYLDFLAPDKYEGRKSERRSQIDKVIGIDERALFWHSELDGSQYRPLPYGDQIKLTPRHGEREHARRARNRRDMELLSMLDARIKSLSSTRWFETLFLSRERKSTIQAILAELQAAKTAISQRARTCDDDLKAIRAFYADDLDTYTPLGSVGAVKLTSTGKSLVVNLEAGGYSESIAPLSEVLTELSKKDNQEHRRPQEERDLEDSSSTSGPRSDSSFDPHHNTHGGGFNIEWSDDEKREQEWRHAAETGRLGGY